MRKIETIKKEIERAQAAIRRAEEALPRLQARMNNAIARLAKAGYGFKGDGNDTMNCINNVRLWSIAYTADEARKGIERRKAEISGRRMDLNRLNLELAEATQILTQTDNQKQKGNEIMNQHKIEVTKVDVYPFKEGAYIGHVKAIANIVLNDQIQVRGLRVMDGENGLFVGYPFDPFYKGEGFRNIVFPITAELRDEIESKVLDEYMDSVE